MITHGGERVTLTAGAPSIRTIGVSLGRIMRFAGHTKYVYSVLAHSLTVAGLMPEHLSIYGLMHDSQESLVSDVPTPMKSQVARNREQTLQQRIYIANGIPWPIPEHVQELVDEADHKALVAEAHILEHPGAAAQWGEDYDPAAGALTKKHLKNVTAWLDADKAGAKFEWHFKRCFNLAGLDKPGEWK